MTIRRPLFLVCLCLVLAAWVFHGKIRGAGMEESWFEAWKSQSGAAQSRYDTGAAKDSAEECLWGSNGSILTATGQVCQKDTEYFYLDSIILEQAAAFPQQTISLTEKLMCEYPEKVDDIQVLLGSTVKVNGTFYAFSQATNPGEFDMASYYHSLEIGGKLRKVSLLESSAGYSRWKEALYGIKSYFHKRLYAIFPEKEASVMCTMLLGEKKGLDSEVKALYQRNGIAHILSISGLHITIIGMGIYALLRRAGVPVWLAAALGGSILLLYSVMTGMSMSAVRAVGMYLLRLLAEVVGRTYDMLTALGIMAVILVWSNPSYFDNAGFYLSFGAVLGMGAVYPALLQRDSTFPADGGAAKQLVGKRGILTYLCPAYEESRFKKLTGKMAEKIRDGLKQSVLAGLSVILATLPIQLWFYYEVPVYSLFLNLLVLPLMSAVMLTGLLAMLAPGLGILGTIDCLILGAYERLCEWCELLPFHTWNPGRPGAWQMAAYYGILFGMVIVKNSIGHKERKKERQEKRNKSQHKACRRNPFENWLRKLPECWRKRLRRAGRLCHALAQPVILTVAVVLLTFHFHGGTSVTFLDVGQGDCICMQAASGEVILFDCGSSSRSEVGKYVLKPYLKYCGISYIDAVFVSHLDSDHLSGVEELLAQGEEWGITVGQVFMPGDIWAGDSWQSGTQSGSAASQSGSLQSSAVLPSGGIRFTCLHPVPGESLEESNAASQCFYIELENGVSILLTGDVEGAGEERLLAELKKRQITKVSVLKVAHHGSKNSTPKELLAQIQPQAAVISCGKNNSYGHPHEELLQRLEACGAIPFITYETGAVTLRSNGEKAILETFLTE